jgi:hypothetical protein
MIGVAAVILAANVNDVFTIRALDETPGKLGANGGGQAFAHIGLTFGAAGSKRCHGLSLEIKYRKNTLKLSNCQINKD